MSETDVATTLIFDLATTLWQRQPRRCHNDVVPDLLCKSIDWFLYDGNFDV